MYENQKKNGFSVPTTVPTVAPVEQKETSNQSTNKTNETIIKEFGSQSEIYKKNKNKVIELQKALVALGYDLGKT
ncbi:MAG: hypothetical protein LBQ59_01470 [Candidatus Peribacteria bacterium]|jgi:hypothetical protein|nr:hypothetical protein [Candidatus Peribacteria bacterium]